MGPESREVSKFRWDAFVFWYLDFY
jgi:hypothetical protein